MIPKNNQLKINLLAKIIILVLALWVLSAVMILIFLEDWPSRGTFGDLFGAVNALYSGLAFAGLIYTIILQKEDLALQRNEIKLNREELKKSAKAQKNSEKALMEQVEQMKLAAKLNAYKTLIEYYNISISNPNNSEGTILKAKEKRKEIIMEIDKLIDRIGDDELDD